MSANKAGVFNTDKVNQQVKHTLPVTSPYTNSSMSLSESLLITIGIAEWPSQVNNFGC